MTQLEGSGNHGQHQEPPFSAPVVAEKEERAQGHIAFKRSVNISRLAAYALSQPLGNGRFHAKIEPMTGQNAIADSAPRELYPRSASISCSRVNFSRGFPLGLPCSTSAASSFSQPS